MDIRWNDLIEQSIDTCICYGTYYWDIMVELMHEYIVIPSVGML